MQVAEKRSLVSQEEREPLVESQEFLQSARRGGMYDLGESYMRGDWDTPDLFNLLFQVMTGDSSMPVRLKKFSPRLLVSLIKDRLLNLQVGERAFEVGKRHYDLGNDLF